MPKVNQAGHTELQFSIPLNQDQDHDQDQERAVMNSLKVKKEGSNLFSPIANDIKMIGVNDGRERVNSFELERSSLPNFNLNYAPQGLKKKLSREFWHLRVLKKIKKIKKYFLSREFCHLKFFPK